MHLGTIATNTSNFLKPYKFDYISPSQCGTDGEKNVKICVKETETFCRSTLDMRGDREGTFEYTWYYNSCVNNWHRQCCYAIVKAGKGSWNDSAKRRMYQLQYSIDGYDTPAVWRRKNVKDGTTDTKPKAKTDTKPKAKTDTKPKAKTDTKPKAKTDTKPKAKTDTKPKAKAKNG